MVLFLLLGSHSVSFCDREEAGRTEGLVLGQSTSVGVYPLGELGRARSTTESIATAASTAVSARAYP